MHSWSGVPRARWRRYWKEALQPLGNVAVGDSPERCTSRIKLGLGQISVWRSVLQFPKWRTRKDFRGPDSLLDQINPREYVRIDLPREAIVPSGLRGVVAGVRGHPDLGEDAGKDHTVKEH